MNTELQTRASCLAVITAIVERMEVVPGRVRIQKMLYFLKRSGVPELATAPFFYHHYGPFSWIVANSLADGVQCNAIVEDAKSSEEDRQQYKYTLGENVRDKVDPLSAESIPLVERLVDRARSEHWRALELASTIDFLEQNEKLERDQAILRAIGLKPACKDYREPALRLLQDLNLSAAAG